VFAGLALDELLKPRAADRHGQAPFLWFRKIDRRRAAM